MTKYRGFLNTLSSNISITYGTREHDTPAEAWASLDAEIAYERSQGHTIVSYGVLPVTGGEA